MLKYVTGYAKGMASAKDRALYFYNRIEERKVFRFVETQFGLNELDEQVFITTIWYETIEPIEQKKEHTFIGSTEINPQDPDWQAKWEMVQDHLKDTTAAEEDLDQETADVDWFLNTDEFPEAEDHAQEGT